jgi:hypothetical protein
MLRKQCLVFKYVSEIHFSRIYERQLLGNSHGFRDVNLLPTEMKSPRFVGIVFSSNNS